MVLNARRGLDSLNIQKGEHDGEKNLPAPQGDAGRESVSLFRAPDSADQRVQHVVHYHAPPGDVADRGIDLLRYIGEGRTALRIRARHSAVADAGGTASPPRR